MANFFTTSIGKKILLSLTGSFLLVFLMVHLTINSMILFDDSGVLFNKAAHFMHTNIIIKIVEPILAIGLVLHLLLASLITLQNQKKRDVSHAGLARYKKRDATKSSKWTSRNMYVLGALILSFLGIHIINFFWKMKVIGGLDTVMIGGESVTDAYTLVTSLFITWKCTVVIYVIGAIALGLHLHHGVWSAFQSIGLSNRKWRKILNVLGILISILLAAGYALIPIYVLLTS